MAKILLVDDEPLLLESLEIILSVSGGHEITGKAGNGLEALDLLSRNEPDVMLLDLNMPRMGGIELIGKVRSEYPDVKMIVLTTFYDEKNISRAIAGGAKSYLLKDSGKDAILNAVDQVISGRSVLDTKVMDKLTSMMAGTSSSASDEDPYEGIDLTDREKEICRLIAEGCTNSQIASILFISEGTVKNYMSSIYDKFDIHDRAKLALKLKDMTGVI